MAKQLNVKLNFQADTSQAEQALAKLTMSLNQISSITPTVGTKLTDDLATAKQSALDLQRHLNNAFNAKTGNLDLSKLDASLKSSGQSLGQLSTNLLKAGSSGESAFLNIQRAVGNASVQINQANGVLTQFWTTLKNTARWQLSSSLLHGFIGGLQSAWGYAKDLDESLNNIRIVTGYSVDKMSDFAEQANKAAKALSTTTTAYTDAALIYYQQGLSDDEVLKRTDITVKMANVARQSAEVVSDQLTAIWNNFYDGSKSLEYYADVLTALGAATASSTDEIAGGLEKFAAIGQTIGLSYEYAASALATITANTRQSEEVVGTALKTIFARIQGLNLGETLDDGTTLNKYSEALQKVGISIFDQAGELKDMDNILDEMGAKWQTLNKAQQTALAQTVAGVRQYTQLVALMDNWDAGDSDSMQANLDTSYNATGTLNKQAEIYADSWEAAVNRVKASAEGIYRDLLPTEEMTGMMKGIEVLLEGVDGLVRGLGGLEGILLLISSIALNAFKNQIGGAIDDLIAKVGGGLTNAFNNISNAFKTDGILGGFKAIVGYSGNVVNQTQQLNSSLQSAADNSQSVGEKMAFTEKAMAGSVSQALKFSMEMTQSANNAQGLTDAFRQYNSNLITINNIQSVIEQSTRHLTKEQREQLVIMQEQAQAANEQVLSAKKLADEAQRRQEALLGAGGDQGSDLDRYVSIEKGDNAGKTAYTTDLMNTGGNIGMVNEGLAAYGKAVGESWNSALISLDAYRNHLALVFDESVDLTQINKEANSAYGDLITASADVSDAISMWSEEAANVPVGKIKEFTGEENKATAAAKQLDSALDSALSELSGKGKLGAQLAKDIQAGIKPTMTLQEKTAHISKGLEQATEKMRTLGVATGSSEKHMETIKKGALDVRDTMHGASTASENLNNKLGQVVNTLNNALQSAMSFGRILSNMASGFSSIAMGISAITNAIETINDEDASFTSKLTAGAMAATMGIRGLMAAMSGLSALAGSVKAAMGITAAAEMAVAVATGKATQADLIQILTEKLGMKSKTAKAVATKLVARAQAGETAGTIADTAANWANVASQAAKLWYITLIIAVIAALVAIIWAAVTAEDAETKALKAANEQLEASKNAYEQAKDAAASFKEEVADYQDALDGLKSLEFGSKELAEAVEEANEKAKKLIETYGLFGKYSYGLNGEIIFNDGVLDGIQNKLNAVEKLAEIDYYGSLINQQNKQQAYDAKNIAEDDVFGQYTAYRKYTVTGSGNYAVRHYDGYLSTEEAEAAIAQNQRASQSRGYLPGAGFQVEKISGNVTGKDIQAIQNVISSLEEVPTSAEGLISAIQDMEEETKGSSGLATYILNDIDSFINEQTFPTLMSFNDSVGEVSEACKYYAEQIAGIMTDDDYAEGIARASGGDEGLAAIMNTAKNTLLNSEDGPDLGQITLDKQNALQTNVLDKTDDWDAATDQKGYVSNFVTDTLTGVEGFTDYDSWMAEHYDEIFAGSTKGYSSNLTTQDMGQAYLESQGYTITNVNNQNGKTTYSVMKDGVAMDDITYDNEIAQDLWAKQVGNYAIDQYVSDQATGVLDPVKFEEMMTNIVANGEQYGADFANAIVAGIANNGEFDFSSLFGEFSGAEIAEMEGMSGQDLAKKFLGITNEEDLKALGFESWADFEAGFKEGLDGWDPSIYADSMNSKYEAIAEANDIDVGEFKAYRKSSEAREGFEDDSGQNYADKWLDNLEATNVEEYTEALNELAIMQTRLSRGYQTLGDNWEDWNKVMTDSEASIDDINEIMPDLNDALADILNWDVADIELLPHDFAQKHWDVIQDVYNGVDGAQEKLAGLAANEYVLSLAIDTEGLDADALAAYNTMTTWLQDMPDLEIGMTLDDTGMYDAFQALLDSGAITADQMNDILSRIGFTPEVEEQTIDFNAADATQTSTGYDYSYTDPLTGETRTAHITQEDYAAAASSGVITIPVINGKKTTYSGGGGSKVSSPKQKGSGGGGGGGSKPKKTDDSRKKKSDVVDRYKEINDKLEESNRLLEKNNTEADRLWGPKRLAKLKENVKIMEQENKQLKQKYELSKQYLAEDAAALREAASAAGISFNIDSVTGNITNYTDAMTQLFNEREALLNSFGSEMDEKEQERLEELDKKIDKVKEAYEDYEKTLDEKKDLEQEQLEKLAEIQQQYYDILSEELEIKLTVNDTDLKVLEYYLGKVQDDFFNMAEAAALMFKDDNFSGYGTNQFDTYMKELGDYQTQYDELVEKYTTINPETGETYINQAQFIEGLQQIQDGLYENLQNIQQLDNTMLHYYGDTLAAAAEELEKFTSLMDHHVETLDHYANLLELLGKSKDFDRMKTVLQTQVDVAENAAEVSKANYEMLAQEAADKKAAWDAAQNNDSLSDYEKSVIEQQWLDAQNAANEAQNQMLEDAEAWAEALKSLLETELAELADTLDKSLSGEWGSLDNMMTAMERASSLQEEYLTTTNQVYETNKLMRTAQQEIDKTTNSVAKRRLKSFIDETEQLQNKNKLSEYELEIQQAKYDLLLAEIALEEAQQAKSTVRLQRDSEGNFGYVYTADQNEIANAQQELEDAQNALYNIGLEGANKYAESYAQTIQEMNDAITELSEQWANGEITSKEEFDKRRLELEEYYGEKLMQYSELHSIALQTDSRVSADAWTRDFSHMTTQTQLWMSNVDIYVAGVEQSMSRYEAGVARIEESVGLDLDSLKEKTENIKNENEALKDSITGEDGLLDAIKDEITEVGKLTLEYAKMRQEMEAATTAAENLAAAIGQTIANESDDDESNDLGPGSTDPNNPDPDPTPPTNTDPDPTPPTKPSLTKGSAVEVKSGTRWYYDSYGSGPSGTARNGTIKYTNLSGSHPYNIDGLGWIKKTDIVGYDTGGYTGNWEGSYGKLAFLHQKELILNAQDTENLLASMDILDKIISTIDLYSSSAQLGGMLSSPRYGGFGEAETLEQNVHIEASFPNVTDHNEIEDALNNLINRASQYAHRK